ncbi:hypothetical protein [Flavobacterium capsici]|uniref:Outer membrane protein beta-barrel domain-containing protein n=1 Tax=Flavobacterium capsici TaxID=3075618 RepID=A0AA96J3D6_9FLAO|nr:MULTISPECIES: hypothetical protein [unclassified Flavobacterium]WNM19173.1 hypothetical protein RN608_00470 [Flavobacterium sp. PMR2A8]WNM20562.1 hypothetical protein RN605_07640 [Flavobacterium sp. PMTSA4]
MESKNDIGKFYKTNLEKLDNIPSKKVWENIELELKKKKERRIILFWFWFTPLFLIFIVFSTKTYLNFNSSKKENQVDTNNSTLKTIDIDYNENNINSNTIENYSVTENNNSIDKDSIENAQNKKTNQESFKNNNSAKKSKKNRETNSTKNNKSKKHISKSLISSVNNKNTFFSTNNSINNEIKEEININENQEETKLDLKSFNKLEDTITKKSSKTAIDSVSKKKEKIKNIKMLPENTTKKDSSVKYRKFEIDIYVSPTLYNTMANKSFLDNRLDNNAKKSNIKSSFGFGLSCNLFEKISFRIGYGITNYSLTTSNVLINTTNYSFINYNPNTLNQSIYLDSNNSETMELTQEISYSEIPLDIKYNLINSKFGINGIAGFSFLILNKNEIYAKTKNGFGQFIGETSNLMKINFTANLGLGIDYKLNKRLKIIVEPIFNYHLNTFDSKNSVKPYSFVIRTGLRYSLNN